MEHRKTAGSYGEYLKIPELLDLQRPLSEPPHHDETLFIIIHQVYELWFKQLLHEIDRVAALLIEGRAPEATRLCRRIAEIQRVLLQQLRVLETMTPPDFIEFRDVLNPASGFQSHQFRAVEFRSGLKDGRFIENQHFGPGVKAMLKAALEDPSLPEAWGSLLRARGFDYPASAADPDELELTERRLRALSAIYADPHDHYDLYVLAEALIEYDENFLLWRHHHAMMVERMIGMKTGTGGSEGVGYLKTTLGKKCFPELWSVRTRIGRTPASGTPYSS